MIVNFQNVHEMSNALTFLHFVLDFEGGFDRLFIVETIVYVPYPYTVEC